MYITATAQDLTNELATALVTRRTRAEASAKHPAGVVTGGLIVERIAAGGIALSAVSNGRDADEMTLLMTPYLESFDAAVAQVNAITKRLAYALGKRGVKVMNYTFSANPKANCNAACIHAIGDTCTCSCGGANHGAASGHITPAFAA